MAATSRDLRTVTIDVTKAELISLLGEKAKTLGLIDFDPDRVQVYEVDPELDQFQIIFEKENV